MSDTFVPRIPKDSKRYVIITPEEHAALLAVKGAGKECHDLMRELLKRIPVIDVETGKEIVRASRAFQAALNDANGEG